MFEKLKKLMGIRSPSLEAVGIYTCGNCAYHDDCICVACEEGNTVVCNILHKHVHKNHTCKHSKPVTLDPLKINYNTRIRPTIDIDEWSKNND